MLCPQCRTDLEHATPFCIDCGATLSMHRERFEALGTGTEPVMRIRPVFRRLAQLRANAPIYLFIALWSAFALSGLARLLLEDAFAGVPFWIPFTVAAGALLSIVSLVGLRMSRHTYANTELIVHTHRLDYLHGFLTVRTRSIALAEIVAVRATCNERQAADDLGTVVISTRAEDPGFDGSIRIHDVPAANELVRRLRLLIDQGEPVPSLIVRVA